MTSTVVSSINLSTSTVTAGSVANQSDLEALGLTSDTALTSFTYTKANGETGNGWAKDVDGNGIIDDKDTLYLDTGSKKGMLDAGDEKTTLSSTTPAAGTSHDPYADGKKANDAKIDAALAARIDDINNGTNRYAKEESKKALIAEATANANAEKAKYATSAEGIKNQGIKNQIDKAEKLLTDFMTAVANLRKTMGTALTISDLLKDPVAQEMLSNMGSGTIDSIMKEIKTKYPDAYSALVDDAEKAKAEYKILEAGMTDSIMQMLTLGEFIKKLIAGMKGEEEGEGEGK